jgi:putative ABC transport system substrate-binding protein
VRLVGVLMSTVKNDPGGLAEMAGFYQGLAEHGWIEGRNARIEVRWASALDIEHVEAAAKELVALKPDVLLARARQATAALKKETSTIPIVFVNVTAPVELGLVQSLAQPGGNITGFTNMETSVGGKMLQLLKEVDPRIARVAVIYSPQNGSARFHLRSMESAASVLSVETVTMLVQSVADIEAAMTAFARQPGGGVVAIPDSFTVEHGDVLVALAARNRLPTIYANMQPASIGGLMAYAVDVRDSMHSAAVYIDRILKGEKPTELAVQQPTRFNLVINLKTAKALGLTIPETLLATADEVIQ